MSDLPTRARVSRERAVRQIYIRGLVLELQTPPAVVRGPVSIVVVDLLRQPASLSG